VTWEQNYAPIGGSLLWSSLVAALPVAVLLYAIGVRRVAAWKASLIGLLAALVVALLAYRMPPLLAIDAAVYGAAFGVFPIFWVVYWAIVLYQLTIETGKFEIIKNSIGSLTANKNVQALLIAFAFGAFVEGAAGFGTPVAVSSAILGGLGFPPFYAAGICLLANTAPVAFGSIGIPLVTLAATTGLPIETLSADVGRLCAPVSMIIPTYLVLVMDGWSGIRRLWPAAIVCGIAFAGMQFVISNFVGPYLTDILSSLAAVVGLIVLLQVWKPDEATRAGSRYRLSEIVMGWSPYLLLIIFILFWSSGGVKRVSDHATVTLAWPGLHNAVRQVPPAVSQARNYAALYRMRLLGESGTACAFAAIAAAALLRVSPARFVRLAGQSAKQLSLAFVSITAVLALAFVMNYSGATATLGLAFAATGRAFPFFSAMLGWLGVFLTGSDTSANALFGGLQTVTANRLGLSAALMASANSAGGVMGKMISLQSISVASAAAGLKAEDEPKLFRFTFKHSVFLASLVGVLAVVYAYAL